MIRIIGRASDDNGKTKVAIDTQGNVVKTPLVIDKRRMLLSAIKKSERGATEKIVLYAPEGWGKTTWASHAERPIFLSTEDGLKGVTVDCFPDPNNWQDVLDAVDELRKTEHNFKTLVIDTADWTEHLCQKFICERDYKDSIEDYGYGKGYVIAFEEWKGLLTKIDALRKEKQMHIIFLAHSTIKIFPNPGGENYDRWEMKTHHKIGSLLQEWSDCLLFGSYDVVVDTERGKKKGKGYGGERVIYANHSAAYDAKNRYGITRQLSSDPSMFWMIVKGGEK